MNQIILLRVVFHTSWTQGRRWQAWEIRRRPCSSGQYIITGPLVKIRMIEFLLFLKFGSDLKDDRRKISKWTCFPSSRLRENYNLEGELQYRLSFWFWVFLSLSWDTPTYYKLTSLLQRDCCHSSRWQWHSTKPKKEGCILEVKQNDTISLDHLSWHLFLRPVDSRNRLSINWDPPKSPGRKGCRREPIRVTVLLSFNPLPHLILFWFDWKPLCANQVNIGDKHSKSMMASICRVPPTPVGATSIAGKYDDN